MYRSMSLSITSNGNSSFRLIQNNTEYGVLNISFQTFPFLLDISHAKCKDILFTLNQVEIRISIGGNWRRENE